MMYSEEQIQRLRDDVESLKERVTQMARYEHTHIENLDEMRTMLSNLLSSLGGGPGTPSMTPDEWARAIRNAINGSTRPRVGTTEAKRLAERIVRFGVRYDQNNRLYTSMIGIGPADVEALAIALLQEHPRS